MTVFESDVGTAASPPLVVVFFCPYSESALAVSGQIFPSITRFGATDCKVSCILDISAGVIEPLLVNFNNTSGVTPAHFK